MASDCGMKLPGEDEEFNEVLKQIGGRGNVYLVCEALRSDSECKHDVLREFITHMFHVEADENLNGASKSALSVQDIDVGRCTAADKTSETAARMKSKTVRTCAITSDKARTVYCAVIIFIFGHGYVGNQANRVTLGEILKDVRARTRRNGARPALLGLIHSDSESPETRASVQVLDQFLRAVFPKQPPDSIWTGHFVPKALDGVQIIRRRICQAVHCSQSSGHAKDRNANFCWPLQTIFRRERRRQPDAPENSLVRKGNSESPEEGIPLQTRSEMQS